jgi:hypothetical protein
MAEPLRRVIEGSSPFDFRLAFLTLRLCVGTFVSGVKFQVQISAIYKSPEVQQT